MSYNEERALELSLQLQARRAPSPDAVIDRVLLAVSNSPTAPVVARRRPAWRTWALPVLAAATVAAVVSGVALVDSSGRDGAAPAVSRSVAPASPTTGPTGASTVTSGAPSSSPVVAPPHSASTLSGFRALDLSFVGPDNGWALGTVDCGSGSGRCAAMATTVDGGRTWRSMAGPPANVATDPSAACPRLCVSHVRFATPALGYVFGPDTLFITTDDGGTWHRMAGGAEALETADGNVIRIVSDGSGCPGPCRVRAQIAPIGGKVWTTVLLANQDVDVASLAFARTGPDAYLLAMRNPAGGAEDASSTLYATHDDGRTWQSYDEPCPQTDAPQPAELDSSTLGTAPDGTLVIGCNRRDGHGAEVVTSTDRARTFAERPTSLAPLAFVGAADASHLFVAFRTMCTSTSCTAFSGSTDGGATFGGFAGGAPRAPSWIGFETSTSGRAIEGRTIWTTLDAGATWSAYTFR
jgi:hypothetical protein